MVSVDILKKRLGLDIYPPDSFDGDVYRKLYISTESYFGDYDKIIDYKYIAYHHYLNHGKQYGHSCDHDPFIFYHIPKCGGTSVHYGIILPNLYRQYTCEKNYIYQIHWLDNNGSNLFTTISYSSYPYIELNTIYEETTDTNNKFLKTYHVKLYDKNIEYIIQYSKILCIIINARGFIDRHKYIKYFICDKNKSINQYLILREPVSLQESTFYYLRDIGTWEKTYGEFNKNMSFRDYINSPNNYVNNWLIRQFSNVSDDMIITDEHFQVCKEELKKITKIGFLEKFDSFKDYLYDRYNWINDSESCELKFNKNNKSKKEKLSEDDINALNNKLFFDKKLYNYFFYENNK